MYRNNTIPRNEVLNTIIEFQDFCLAYCRPAESVQDVTADLHAAPASINSSRLLNCLDFRKTSIPYHLLTANSISNLYHTQEKSETIKDV